MVYLALPQWNVLHVIVCYNHQSTCTECCLHSPCTPQHQQQPCRACAWRNVGRAQSDMHCSQCLANHDSWHAVVHNTHGQRDSKQTLPTHTSEAACMSHHAATHPTPTCSHPRRWHWATLPPLCLSWTFFASPPLHCKSKSQPTEHDNNTHRRALQTLQQQSWV